MKLEFLRKEFEREVIGPAILQEVYRACHARARKYPPSIYGGSHAWDEDAINDLAQDVIVDRLLGENQLDYLFDMSRTVKDWRALLDRQIRITLARRRVRTVVDNMLDRARRVLRGDDNVAISKFGRWTVFKLVESTQDYQPLTDEQIRSIVEKVRVIPRQPPSQSDRAPSVYGKRYFQTLLYIVLEEATGGVTVRDLGMVFEKVFTDWVPAVLELSEEIPHSEFDAPDTGPEVREAAEKIIAKMTKEDAIIIRGRLAGLPDVEVAPLLGISRPTLIKRRNILFNKIIRPIADDLDEKGQDALIERVAMAALEKAGADGTDNR